MIFTVLRRNRDFRRLFAAELVMFGGDWLVMVPLLVLLPRLCPRRSGAMSDAVAVVA